MSDYLDLPHRVQISVTWYTTRLNKPLRTSLAPFHQPPPLNLFGQFRTLTVRISHNWLSRWVLNCKKTRHVLRWWDGLAQTSAWVLTFRVQIILSGTGVDQLGNIHRYLPIRPAVSGWRQIRTRTRRKRRRALRWFTQVFQWCSYITLLTLPYLLFFISRGTHIIPLRDLVYSLPRHLWAKMTSWLST